MQFFAHDVRRPFRSLKMLIDLLESEKDPQEAKKILQESLFHIHKTMTEVDGMITNLLEMGSKSKLTKECVLLETLTESAVKEVLDLYPNSKTQITSFFNHNYKIAVDIPKIKRVFINIFENAIQSLDKKGSIWIKTQDLQKKGQFFVLVCIGNNGRLIPKENISKIFDMFFTNKKNGGTGLGLSIAKKIILLHGGKIWCESSEQNGVEFFFTLPRSCLSSESDLI